MKKQNRKKKLIVHYFNIRHFEFTKPRSFYIRSFEILCPTWKLPNKKIPKISNSEMQPISQIIN